LVLPSEAFDVGESMSMAANEGKVVTVAEAEDEAALFVV